MEGLELNYLQKVVLKSVKLSFISYAIQLLGLINFVINFVGSQFFINNAEMI